MKYEAIESFSGIISMSKGEVREIPNEDLAKELINAGFIAKYKPDNAKELKKELEEANSKIEELENTINELNAELESLKTSDENPDENSDENSDEDLDNNSDENSNEEE